MNTNTNKELRAQVALLDVKQCQLRAAYFAKRIETGVYKSRVGHVYRGGLPEHGGVPYTEQEILEDEVRTMNTHIANAEDRLEYAKTLIFVDLPVKKYVLRRKAVKGSQHDFEFLVLSSGTDWRYNWSGRNIADTPRLTFDEALELGHNAGSMSVMRELKVIDTTNNIVYDYSVFETACKESE